MEKRMTSMTVLLLVFPLSALLLVFPLSATAVLET
jgi:hypothetical protein